MNNNNNGIIILFLMVIFLVKECLDEIKPCLINKIINLQKFDTWKIQITIAIKCISFKDVDEKCVMHLKSNNIECMPYDNGN